MNNKVKRKIKTKKIHQAFKLSKLYCKAIQSQKPNSLKKARQIESRKNKKKKNHGANRKLRICTCQGFFCHLEDNKNG